MHVGFEVLGYNATHSLLYRDISPCFSPPVHSWFTLSESQCEMTGLLACKFPPILIMFFPVMLPPLAGGVSLGLLSDPEVGGEIFLREVDRLSSDYVPEDGFLHPKSVLFWTRDKHSFTSTAKFIFVYISLILWFSEGDRENEIFWWLQL